MKFTKYHGTGNDFIVIDNRDQSVQLDSRVINHMCHRRFGIGADGLMLLENADGYHFRMVYFNADGNESSMCGNGGRCIAAFAKKLELFDVEAHFIATDGPHKAHLQYDGRISLQMKNVDDIQISGDATILNTGSPHLVTFVPDASAVDVYHEGRKIRYNETWAAGGINVNFAQRIDGKRLFVRTYERGVEDETLSCGTGAVATAIAAAGEATGAYNITLETPGGILEVAFEKTDTGRVHSVVLTGPAVLVFEGEFSH